MSVQYDKHAPHVEAALERTDSHGSVVGADELALANMGYKQEFIREFSNWSTISFAMAVTGMTPGIMQTMNTPFLLGGPAAVTWCWFIGVFMCLCLGLSIGEIVSAYPSSGGMYAASAYLVPVRWRPITAWTVGWLNLLGQLAAFASVQFAIAQMILATVTVSTAGTFVPSAGVTYATCIGVSVLTGAINSVSTKMMAQFAKSFVFFNVGTAVVTIIALCITCDDKQGAAYIFTETLNGSGWNNNGIAFMLGFLMVSMTDYDAPAHISEEVQKAAVAAPAAIIISVVGTGSIGWILIIIYVMCSGPLAELDGGVSGYVAAQILIRNLSTKGFYVIWSLTIITLFQAGIAILTATSRSAFAFSRDGGMPDRGLFARLAANKIPIYAVWLTVLCNALLCLLDFASLVAIEAIFAMTALALDTSYVVPIACKVFFRDHPEVQFKPGPFTLGRGWLGKAVNLVAVFWTAFIVVILSLPEYRPVTADNMNYASVVTVAVVGGALLWFFLGGRKYYSGPRGSSNAVVERNIEVTEALDESIDEK